MSIYICIYGNIFVHVYKHKYIRTDAVFMAVLKKFVISIRYNMTFCAYLLVVVVVIIIVCCSKWHLPVAHCSIRGKRSAL